MKLKHFFHSRDVSSFYEPNVFRRIGKDAYVDWLIIVLVSVAIAATLSIRGWITYVNVSGALANKNSSAANAKAMPLDTHEFDLILNDFDNRAKLRLDMQKGYSGPVDPSL